MINEFKPMKIRESELNRLKQVQQDFGYFHTFSDRPIYSLSECVEYLLDIMDELKSQGHLIEWHTSKTKQYRITLTMQKGEANE